MRCRTKPKPDLGAFVGSGSGEPNLSRDAKRLLLETLVAKTSLDADVGPAPISTRKRTQRIKRERKTG